MVVELLTELLMRLAWTRYDVLWWNVLYAMMIDVLRKVLKRNLSWVEVRGVTTIL